jgi:hypothetical protein
MSNFKLCATNRTVSIYPKMLYQLQRTFSGEIERPMENEQQGKWQTLTNFILGTTQNAAVRVIRNIVVFTVLKNLSNEKCRTKKYLT